MREYTVGKKSAAVVLHQMFLICMIAGIYALAYAFEAQQMGMSRWFIGMIILGLAGSFIALAYLTNGTGRKTESDPAIYYNRIDRIYTEILLLIFIGLIVCVVKTISWIRIAEFDLASLLVTVCAMAYIYDAIFLYIYTSIIRRVKGDVLFKNSLIAKIVCSFKSNSPENGYRFRTQKRREIIQIQSALEAIAKGELDTTLDVESFHGQEKAVAEAFNHIRDGLQNYANESLKNEKLKADLITNVSHDIKTPLTSIVNYVELLKREDLSNENAKNYIRIIDEKSQRLKQLTEDLVEASKISSGNITVEMATIDFVELMYQIGGEFNERFEEKDLTIVTKMPSEGILIEADGRHLFRVIENLYTNVAKYALEKTRVYVDLAKIEDRAVFTIKNISKNLLTDVADNHVDLTERFVRGERSRTTEGSGLGLSIAKSLTTIMGGSFDITVDGDLFIATISFKMV